MYRDSLDYAQDRFTNCLLYTSICHGKKESPKGVMGKTSQPVIIRIHYPLLERQIIRHLTDIGKPLKDWNQLSICRFSDFSERGGQQTRCV